MQTLKNIEIVAVNDFSTDNTLNILKKISKNDKRIKIINNDRNHGLLYTRAMGILNSTGKFIMNLDPDDLFTGNNVLEILYNKSQKLNLDLIEFWLLRFNMKNISFLNETLIMLKNRDYNYINSESEKKPHFVVLITNKFVKREVIMKAYNYFSKKIYKNKWNYHEDHIWHWLIKKYAKSTLHLEKFIYLYLINSNSLMNKVINPLEEKKNSFYRFEMLEDIFSNKNLKKLNYINKDIKQFFNQSKTFDIDMKNRINRIFVDYFKYYTIKKMKK